MSLRRWAWRHAFMRGHFANGDAFIAFLGMDLRAKDSGKKNGPRHLPKKGDTELRRLAHNAAMAACRSATWKPYYESYLARGLAKTQALVILARKLCRGGIRTHEKRKRIPAEFKAAGFPCNIESPTVIDVVRSILNTTNPLWERACPRCFCC